MKGGVVQSAAAVTAHTQDTRGTPTVFQRRKSSWTLKSSALTAPL
jgi:hypothetical protein